LLYVPRTVPWWSKDCSTAGSIEQNSLSFLYLIHPTWKRYYNWNVTF
jgi:hypothetical protein